jgi:hypothetical protein
MSAREVRSNDALIVQECDSAVGTLRIGSSLVAEDLSISLPTQSVFRDSDEGATAVTPWRVDRPYRRTKAADLPGRQRGTDATTRRRRRALPMAARSDR